METLSDKIWNPKAYNGREVIHIEDVKEFIRQLKDRLTMDGFGHCVHEKCDSIVKKHIIEDINKLAGENLI